ncbi:MAG: hypothetical protein ACD_48C00129G0002 [uncultured bacterium]|nr:MAG: hypothetical protein ACD_48C00129G0002 [uncultured bacterium]
MPEKEVYGRCEKTGCKIIIQSVLKYEGENPNAIYIYPESPIIDECQDHHLATGLEAQHNALILFTSEADAREEPVDDTKRDANSSYLKIFPKAFGQLTVSRQRNFVLHCRRMP